MPETPNGQKRTRTMGPLHLEWTQADGKNMESPPFKTEAEAVAWLKENAVDDMEYRLVREVWRKIVGVESVRKVSLG